ncbi:MAG: cupin domain-containing protein [Anaerolineales bacterium]|nr:cupin domain-containing protein [Anaerolineales bacterium]
MSDLPISVRLNPETGIPEQYDNHIQRSLSDLKGQFQNEVEYYRMMAEEDRLLYEVYELSRPHVSGELLTGVSVIHSGLIGDEFVMTKGHFHEVLETAECYYCLQGQGAMVLENPEGDCVVEPMQEGSIVYIPPRWAHRAVNTSLKDKFVFLFVYPAHSGHDYGTIESRGFRKLVLYKDGEAVIVENPGWSAQGSE